MKYIGMPKKEETSVRSFENYDGICYSEVCGCYHCMDYFSKGEIHTWSEDKRTASCPYCGEFSVVPYFEHIDKSMQSFKTTLLSYNKKYYRI
jgi:hypothetical protein